VGVNAHICIMHPRQRGANFSIAVPGSHDCFRRTAECGGMPAEHPRVTWRAGEFENVLFQQNLNHYWADAANKREGFLDVAISYNFTNPGASDFTTLASTLDYPAHEMVMQSNFSLFVRVPDATASHAVIRVRYVSLNPDETFPNNTDSTFYNCADVEIIHRIADDQKTVSTAPDSALALAALEKLQRKFDHVTKPSARLARLAKVAGTAPVKRSTGCCVPPQATMSAMRTIIDERGTQQHIIDDIEYDATKQLQRYTQFTSGKTGFYAITDYKNGIEYVVDIASNKCELYGPDFFYPICYGDQAAPGTQRVVQQIGNFVYFANNDYTWSWVVQLGATGSGQCWPVDDYHMNGTFAMLRSYVQWDANVDPSHLTKPSTCM